MQRPFSRGNGLESLKKSIQPEFVSLRWNDPDQVRGCDLRLLKPPLNESVHNLVGRRGVSRREGLSALKDRRACRPLGEGFSLDGLVISLRILFSVIPAKAESSIYKELQIL